MGVSRSDRAGRSPAAAAAGQALLSEPSRTRKML